MCVRHCELAKILQSQCTIIVLQESFHEKFYFFFILKKKSKFKFVVWLFTVLKGMGALWFALRSPRAGTCYIMTRVSRCTVHTGIPFDKLPNFTVFRKDNES